MFNIPEVVKMQLTYLLKGKEGIGELDIEYALSRAREYICNYCNIQSVPKQVYSTWANMALDIIKNDFPNIFNEIDNRDISHIKAGDTDITLGGNGGKSAETLEKAMITSYSSQLHSIRRIKYGD